MICTRCRKPYDDEDSTQCPHCGAPAPARRTGVLKTCSILISAGDAAGVYKSLKDVPARLRGRLVRSTSGINAATILIADKNGRAEIVKAMRRLSSRGERRALESLLSRDDEGGWRLAPRVRKVLALVLVLFCLALIWTLFVRLR